MSVEQASQLQVAKGGDETRRRARVDALASPRRSCEADGGHGAREQARARGGSGDEADRRTEVGAHADARRRGEKEKRGAATPWRSRQSEEAQRKRGSDGEAPDHDRPASRAAGGTALPGLQGRDQADR